MARIALWFLILSCCRAAETTTLVRSYAPRVVSVAITSSGWDDKPAFLEFARNCATTITNLSVWKDYANYWTITAVYTNNGIPYSLFPPSGIRVGTMDWYLVVRNAGQDSADVQIVIANTFAWAGSTGNRIVVTRNPAKEILEHELFHLIGGCGDEYTYPGIEQHSAISTIPNLASSWYNAYVKWGTYIESGTLPAPFEGGSGWWKPTERDCIMFDPFKPPCVVCYKAQRTVWLNMIGQEETKLTKPKATIHIIP